MLVHCVWILRSAVEHFPFVDDLSCFIALFSFFAMSSSASTASSIPASSSSSSSCLDVFDLFDGFVENANVDCLGGAAVPFGLPKNFLGQEEYQNWF